MDLDSVVLNSSIFIDLKEKIGEGSFGIVRRGVVRDMDESVAVKLEASRNSRKGELLLNETNVMKDLQCTKGVPTFYYYGVQDEFHYVVMQLLGHSLSQKMRECKRRLSLHTTLMLLDQMLSIIESVHKAGYVYRDINPHNFLFGLSKRSQDLFLIDYGLAKKQSLDYPTSRGTVLCKGYVGTLPFISLNAHIGVKCARRDDLESIGYLAIYMQLGKLPWYTHTCEPSERETRISKQDFEALSRSFGVHVEFLNLITYARALKFDEIPDYGKIRAKFRALAERSRLRYDWVYDWDELLRKTTVERRSRRRYQSSVNLPVDVDEDALPRPFNSFSSLSMVGDCRRDSKCASRSSYEKPPRKMKRKRTLVMQFCGFKHRDEVKDKLEELRTRLISMQEPQAIVKEQEERKDACACF